MRSLRYSLIAGLLLLSLAGCSSNGPDGAATADGLKPEGYHLGGSPEPSPESEAPASFAAGELEPIDQAAANGLSSNPESETYRRTYGRSTAPLYPVFFDFDSSAIKENQLDNLNSSAAYLLENQGSSLVIEGNCDERGTTDYNLALGELRALRVKKYLLNYGVAPERIRTISYGSQRPLYPGSDEQSWAMNRRADLVIP